MVNGTIIDVRFSLKFKQHLKHFPKEDKLKIKAFIDYVRENGFDGLAGRNKSSDNIPPNDPYWKEKVTFAQQHSLWHYHIGIPYYDKSKGFGDYTSEYVLHYVKGEDFIRIVDFSPHPPFNLPLERYLAE